MQDKENVSSLSLSLALSLLLHCFTISAAYPIWIMHLNFAKLCPISLHPSQLLWPLIFYFLLSGFPHKRAHPEGHRCHLRPSICFPNFIMRCLLGSSKLKQQKKASLQHPRFYIHNTSFQSVSRCQSTSSHVISGAHWELHWGHFHMSDRDKLHGSQGSSPTLLQDPDVKPTVTQLCTTEFYFYWCSLSVRPAAAEM